MLFLVFDKSSPDVLKYEIMCLSILPVIYF
jgi:hypothetical protein